MNESTELWLPIAGWEDEYEVSDLGQVRSLDRVIVRRNGWLLPRKGQVLSPQLGKRGYFQVILPDRRHHYVHTLVAVAFIGPRPHPRLQVRHRDGNYLNNHAENLMWGTPAANMRDKIEHGTHQSAQISHCTYGHLLEWPNLTRPCKSRPTSRLCLACNRAYANRQKARKYGRPFDFQVCADAHYSKIMVRVP